MSNASSPPQGNWWANATNDWCKANKHPHPACGRPLQARLLRGSPWVDSAPPGRCPCHLAGRSFRASCPPLTRRKLRFAIQASLSFRRRSIGRGNAPRPSNCEKNSHWEHALSPMPVVAVKNKPPHKERLVQNFLMPSLGADMEAGTLVAWKKQPGETVHRGETIAEVDTDKGVIDVEVFHDGVIDSLLVGPGTRVPVGMPLATIRDSDEAAGAPAELPPPPQSAPVIVGDDRQARMRRAIAAAMSRSKREIPHFYVATTIDVTAVAAHVADSNAALPPEERLLLGAAFLKAAALAVREVPEVNAVWRNDAVESVLDVNVGLAVSLRGGGLVILTLRDVADQSLATLSQQIRDRTARARTGRLKASELADSTLTVTSLGDRGVDAVWGVIYPPQVAIVGFGSVTERPLAVNGRCVVRQAVTATLAADHRALDGHRAGLYLRAVADVFRDPEAL